MRKVCTFVGKSLLILAVVVVFAGCTTSVKSDPGVSISGLTLQTLERDEFEILDRVEGTGRTTTILGLITLPFNRQAGYVSTQGVLPIPPGPLATLTGSSRVYKAQRMALYNALAQVPEADVVLPTKATIEISSVIPFIIKVQTATVAGKAIRVKTDSER